MNSTLRIYHDRLYGVDEQDELLGIPIPKGTIVSMPQWMRFNITISVKSLYLEKRQCSPYFADDPYAFYVEPIEHVHCLDHKVGCEHKNHGVVFIHDRHWIQVMFRRYQW